MLFSEIHVRSKKAMKEFKREKQIRKYQITQKHDQLIWMECPRIAIIIILETENVLKQAVRLFLFLFFV